MTKMKKVVGGYEYEQEVDGNELVLRFHISKTRAENGVTPTGLSYAIESALRADGDRPARIQRERIEREGAGVDPFVLSKIRRDIDKMLVKYDNRKIREAQNLVDAVHSFKKGERIKIKDTVTDLGGKYGSVLGLRKKYVLVEIEGKKWRVGPNLIVKEAR